MRSIDRRAETCPAVLQSSSKYFHILKYKLSQGPSKVNKSIYGHPDVVEALKRLFSCKCSYCEILIDEDGIVEHFIPHCPERPKLAYDWSNLHWACQSCSQRKRKKKYKEYIPRTTIVKNTLLIDPTSQSAPRPEIAIWYDDKLKAYVQNTFEVNILAIKTVEFINDNLPATGRLITYASMMRFIAESECITEWKILSLQDPIDHKICPNPDVSLKALRAADRLYKLFLNNTNSFSTSMRFALGYQLGINAMDILRMSDYYGIISASAN
ncbi:hypothetical protein [Fimbriiglobus ruber]|uniref:hypothetical protein n=1 Tax=Fimbriiglobus ruber TaxID=1908690 RepID=UPI001179BB2F|nr:hypothetical protein [Fimbriiglobus ruber]